MEKGRWRTSVALTAGTLALGALFSACTPRQQEAAREDTREAKEKIGEASRDAKGEVAELSADARLKKQEYERAMETRLEKIDRDLDALKERSKKATGEAKAKWDREIASLEDERAAVRTKFNEVRTATGNAWESFKDGLDKAAEKLEASYNSTLEKMKTDQ